MAKSWNTPGFWIALVVAAVGPLLTAVQGLTFYMRYTAKPLHPDPGKAPAVARAELAQPWKPAVQSARKVLRAALSEQNLPGLSVAVGVGGEVFWERGIAVAVLSNISYADTSGLALKVAEAFAEQDKSAGGE